MKRLTPKEEQIMQIMWRIGKGYVRDILEQLPEPQPSYTTVSTIIRILEKKGFIGHRVFGNTHEYYPRIEKNSYLRFYMRSIVRTYFEDSYRELVSFFAREEQLEPNDLEKLLEQIRKQKKNG